MADLIAQGPEPHHRWRRTLADGDMFVLGRDCGAWSVPWDERISRRHAELVWSHGRLHVTQIATARNPVFVRGQNASSFDLRPGEHFVIGQTTFTLSDEQVHVSLAGPEPIREQTFSAEYLRHVRFRNADQRLEVLSRLPDVISGAASEPEMLVRLVNLLFAGIGRAEAAAVVAADADSDASPAAASRNDSKHDASTPPATDATTTNIRVLHWDRRFTIGGSFEPSRRLILEAIARQQSVLHVWGGRPETGPSFTVNESFDWAFCTPVPGEACRGWAMYVAGRFAGHSLSPTPTDPTDLGEDLKFTELVAATLNSLRQLQHLQRKNASLSQFFPPAVLSAVAADDRQALQPREAEVSVLFCDLQGFSQKAERDAGNLLGLLERVSQALGVMTHQILARDGVIGDFQGDAAMGFWGWPLPQPDMVQRACLTALAIRAEFEAAAVREGHPLADFRVGIGLATGRAVAGGIGTIDQLKVTVFGPVVNLASRLEAMTRLIRAPILLDAATAQAVREHVPRSLARSRRVALVRPYGMEKAVEVSELLPPAATPGTMSDADLAQYEAALDSFLAGNWSEALDLLHLVPARDRVKDFLTVYIARHGRTPPAGWDRVIALDRKGEW